MTKRAPSSRKIKRHKFTDEERKQAFFNTTAALAYAVKCRDCLVDAHADHAAAYVRRAIKSIEGARRHAGRMLPHRQTGERDG